MTDKRALTPERILDLFAEVRQEGPRLGMMILDTLAMSQESRDHCRHLVPLFEGESAEQVTYWQVYLAHHRWAGAQQWKEWERDLIPQDLELLFHRLDRAAGPNIWGLVEAQCESSRQLARADRSAAEALARRAVPLAQKAPVDVLDESCREELIALAYATLANAHRAQDQIEPARIAMQRAEHHMALAPASPMGLAAVILSLRATLESWERRFLDCQDTLDAALRLQPSGPLKSRILIKRANIDMAAGYPMEALDRLQQAEQEIDNREQPHLWLCAAQNRLWVLTELERFEEAADALPEVLALAQTAASPVEMLQIRWVQARLAAKQGRLDIAEARFQETRTGFLEHRLAYSAAVVSIELARLLFHQGRLEEVKTLIMGTLAEFDRQQVEPELINALALLEEAVLSQKLTLRVLQKAAELVSHRAGR